MKKPHILIVDDLPDNLLSLYAILNNDDYKITSCISGTEALKHLMDEKVDLILLDIQMPVMDGFQTAEAVRTQPKCDSIPIIFISSIYNDEQSLLKGYHVGAADYMTKPIRPEVLKEKVKFFINFREKIKFQQKHADADLQYQSFMNTLKQIINPLWTILLSVQMLKKTSATNHEKLLNTLDKKLDNLEISTEKLKELIFSYKNQVEEQIKN